METFKIVYAIFSYAAIVKTFKKLRSGKWAPVLRKKKGCFFLFLDETFHRYN